MARVPKSTQDLLADLRTHLFLLDKTITEWQSHPAIFIWMACQLRTLVTRGEGGHLDLLPYLAKKLNTPLPVVIQRPDGEKHMTFDAYLEQKSYIGGQEYSHLGYTKLLCNHSGSYIHVREHADNHAYVGSNVYIFGVPLNSHMLLSIAKTTSSVAHAFLEQVAKMSPEAIAALNTQSTPPNA